MAAHELLLLRHGIAEERSPDRPDAARSLTPRGIRRTRQVLHRAAALGLKAGRLLSSPLVRARQTGEIAVACGLAPALELADALAPGGDPLPLLREWLAGGASEDGRRLVLVGHEPDLGHLAALLVGATPGSIELRKAGLALLSLEPGEPLPSPGCARLRLLLSPRALLA